jgi:hypothetical protein
VIDVEKLDWSRCTYPPFDHQIEGVHKLIKNKAFGLLDEMGAGKTKQIIDAACFLYETGEIDTVVIMCPAAVKTVWIHPQYSQIIEHSFVKGVILEFTGSSKALPSKDRGLTWVITSVELLRNLDPKTSHTLRLKSLLKGRRVWGVVDESSVISNPKASQTRAVLKLSPSYIRRTILNGTPVGNSPLTLYSQFDFLNPAILGFKNFFAFRNRHARMGGFMNKQIVGFERLEEIQAKVKPYVLRRLKKDCLDIEPKMYMPLREVKLSPDTWKIYCQMRSEFVAYLGGQEGASIVQAAPVKSLRLAQICSGFLGGFVDDFDDTTKTFEIGCELTTDFLDNLEHRISIDPNYRLIVWCRFRPEINRLYKLTQDKFPKMMIKVLQGGLSKGDSLEAKSLFHPDAPDPDGPALLIAQPQAGRFGSNFTKCSNVDYLSNDYSWITRSQSEDRIHRPGQRFQALFQDYVVVGPNRERTISGLILKALRKHEEVANWTCKQWEAEIMQEDNDVPF